MGISQYFNVIKNTFNAFKSMIFCIAYATLLAMIPLLFPSMPGKGAYILLLMVGLWITEMIPLYVTALLPVILCPLFGIASASTISAAYMRDANMLFFGTICISCAIEHNNLHKRIAVSIFKFVGTDPKMLLLGFMLPTWFLSMWMSNSATTVIMMTVVDAILENLNLLNVDFIEETVNSVEENETHNARKCLQLFKKFIPYNSQQDGNTHCKSIESIELKQKTKRMKRMKIAFSLCVPYASTCGGIATIIGTGPNTVLYGTVLSRYGHMTGLTFGTWIVYAMPISILTLFCVWIWLVVMFFGIRGCFDCKQPELQKKKIIQIIDDEYQKLGRFTFAEGLCSVLVGLLTILCITRNFGSTGWEYFFNSKHFISDTTPAILLAFLAMILPATNPITIFNTWKESSIKGNAPDPHINRTLLPWNIVQKKVPWGLFLLLGGGFALAETCELSGLSRVATNFLSIHLSNVPVWILSMIFTTLGALITEFASNVATASVLIPIVLILGESLHLNPLALALPTTVGTSLAFALPASTPPNAIAFAKGHVKVIDMIQVGLILNIMACLITVTATNTYGTVLFGFNKTPTWIPHEFNKTIT